MIPFFDLKAQYNTIREDIGRAIAEVLESGWFILGKQVGAFEEEFARYLGAGHAIGVASGTEALQLALMALGIGPGDEVITVPNTAVATAVAIACTGARPVFVDIDPATFNMDCSRLEEAVSPRTRAILPVHLYGQPADMEPIMQTARRHGLFVVEDACQAHGAGYRGRKVGTLGDLGCFSFYPTKNLGAYGDGGLVVTNDARLAEKVRLLRTYGWGERRYVSLFHGINSRLDEMQAAILRAKLPKLDGWNEARRERARVYDDYLCNSDVVIPATIPDATHVYHLYVIRTPKRDKLQEFLRSHGVGTLIHYPVPIHIQDAYRQLGAGPGSFPAAEQAAQEILSLPLYPELSLETVERVASLVRQFGR